MNDDGIKKRLRDLSRRSYNNNQYTFTDFLAMADLSDFYDMTVLPSTHEMSLAPCGYTVNGGYEGAERCMIRFGNEEELGYDQPFPMNCIKISPLQDKFSDALSHRDFLGALMNLGIEREKLGDILVKGNSCFVFANETVTEVIIREITRVKHTSVIAKIADNEMEAYKPMLEAGTVQAKSPRIDSFIAKVHKLSRNDSAQLFVTSKVFVNGRLMSNESYQLKPEDVITVRGFGKVIYHGESGSTRKGNMILNYERYI